MYLNLINIIFGITLISVSRYYFSIKAQFVKLILRVIFIFYHATYCDKTLALD